jgi:hypothetical protein
MLKGCLAVVALVFLIGGLVFAYHLIEEVPHKTFSSPSPPPAVVPPPSEPIQVAEIIPEPPPPPSAPLVPKRIDPVLKMPPLPPLPAVPLKLPERINRAIDRGVEYLRKHHNGHDQYRNYLGLLGLTLLECGVPGSDPAVRQIAGWLRTRENDLANTYELALAILFFDRLEDPRDKPLIRTFGQRLLNGQLDCGAWTYSCPVNSKPRPGSLPMPPARGPQGPQIISWKYSTPLNKPVRRPRPVFQGDNSNTQFAILGLWVAQRYGVSARGALLATEQCFRAIQLKDGSWSYHANQVVYRDSMTCAGLMSLAMRHGMISGQGRDIRPDQPASVSDRAVTQALDFLGLSIDKVTLSGGRITGVEARDPLYFLWSLERMAMIYDLRTLGEKEWYPWAARMLVDVQQSDGSWHAPYEAPIGTCFALLVLRRSNLARDLQLTVQSQPPRRDPRPAEPSIIQGPEAALGAATTRREPDMAKPERAPKPLQGTTIQAPNGVSEIPKKK